MKEWVKDCYDSCRFMKATQEFEASRNWPEGSLEITSDLDSLLILGAMGAPSVSDVPDINSYAYLELVPVEVDLEGMRISRIGDGPSLAARSRQNLFEKLSLA